jgi:hypothetical protein
VSSTIASGVACCMFADVRALLSMTDVCLLACRSYKQPAVAICMMLCVCVVCLFAVFV